MVLLVQELVRGLLKHVQAINGVPGSFADLLLNLKDCKTGAPLPVAGLSLPELPWCANRSPTGALSSIVSLLE